MEISKILTADVLDIIFEGRNKEYGAYDLRRTYGKRLVMSLSVMFLFMGLLYGGMVVAGNSKDDDSKELLVTNEIKLEQYKEPEKEPEMPPPPKPQTPQVRTEVFVDVIRIVPEDVPADPIPPVDDLVNAKIGSIKTDGLDDVGIGAPPSSDGVGQQVIVEPKREPEDEDAPFMSVQIESEFPGGPAAWQRFLHKNLGYPQMALDNEIQGTVVVQFIVDKEGNVSDVQAISGPEELRAEAVRVIKKSGKWTAAIQNGRKVKSYKNQPIGFQIGQE